MAVSLIQLDQIRKSYDFDDSLNAAAIAGIETSAVDHLDFLKGMLSQTKRIIHGADAGNWYDDIESAAEPLNDLAARAKLEDKMGLWDRLNLNDVSVPATQNYVLLTATGNTAPDKVIAINATTEGAATAQLAGAVGSHSLTEQAGPNPLEPKNLCQVFDGATGDPILSSSRRVYALLQVGSAATDGNAFADSGNDQGQLSFVRPNATYDDFEACPVTDIESQSIIYSFSWRRNLNDVPEEYFRSSIASADPQAGVTVSLDEAYNGAAFITADGADIDFRLADTVAFKVRLGTGNDLFKVTRTDTGPAHEVQIGSDVATFNNDAVDSDFANGMTVDSTGQAINIGKTANGVIDSASAELRANTGDAEVSAASGEVRFTSSRDTDLELDDATAGAISGLFGQTFSSISAAIKYAGEQGGVDLSLKVTVLASNYAQGVNVPGAIQDITAAPIDMNTPATVEQLVFLNGRLLYGGNGTTKNDVYAGDTPGSGDVKFDFSKGVKTGDVIISAVLAQ